MGKNILATLPQVTITTSGSAVPLTSEAIFAKEVNIESDDNNVGDVFYGDENVDASTERWIVTGKRC